MRALLVAAAVAALLGSGCRGPGPFALDGAVAATASPSSFLAGVASVELTPPAGYPLGGYGGGARRADWPFYFGVGWPGQLALACHQAWHEGDPEGTSDQLVPATGVHDPLLAKALVLRPAEGPPLALVRLDTLAVTAELHAGVAAAVRDLGYRPETVLVCATHTHSGPGAFMRAPLARVAGTDNFREELEVRLIKAAAEAVRRAHAAAVPAALGVTTTRDRGPDGGTVLAKNRRARAFRGEVADDAVDDEVVLVRVDRADDGPPAPLAVVVLYAVHPTVLGPDNHRFSADVTGAVERALEARVGAPVLFVNGAQGDVGPRRPDPDPDEPFARCDALGTAFAALVAPALEGLATSDRLRVTAAQGAVDLGRPFTVVALGRARFLDSYTGAASWLLEPLALPFDLLLWALGLTNVRVELTYLLGLGLVVDLGPYVERTTTRVGGVRLETGRDDLALLTLPGEGTHDVGLAAKAAARARGATRAAVVGLCLDHVGYVASEVEYRRGGYEATMTLFGPGEAAAFGRAHEVVLDALFPRAPGDAGGRTVTPAAASRP